MTLARKRKRSFMSSFLGCFRSPCDSSISSNDSWILFTNRGEDNDAARHSVDSFEVMNSSANSSFRFSTADFDPRPVILRLNLESGFSDTEVCLSRIYSVERNLLSLEHGLTRFRFDDIRLSTSNFSQDKLLGKGAHSCVYKGRIAIGKSVAVKMLDIRKKDLDKDFCRELHIASRLKNHPNVASLLGFCIDPRGLFIVYKFVSGGSLDHHLHEKDTKSCLSWSARFRVAKGIAKALTYIHGDGSQRCVVHRDLKPSNILLTSRKNPKLCDFGLATVIDSADSTFLCKTVKGTLGYLAPEYFQNGKVSSKTDIYAFGVVLLELLTGRKSIDTQRGFRDRNLVSWASPLLSQRNVEQLVDWRLKQRKAFNLSQTQRVMTAASLCLQQSEMNRPCMADILAVLRGGVPGDSRVLLREESQRSSLLMEQRIGSDKMSALRKHFALVMDSQSFHINILSNQSLRRSDSNGSLFSSAAS